MTGGSPVVLAVVPAFDEEETVGRTVKALAGMEGVDRVVVVADGCTDRTVDEARGAGARVLSAPKRRGKGEAVEAALARLPVPDVYLLVDADVGDTAGETAKLLAAVLAGEADLAIGRLPAQQGGGFGLVKRFAGRAIRALTGYRAQEPLSGQRAVTLRCIQACRPLARGFGLETAMTIDAVRGGFRVREIPVDMRHRATGRSVSGFAHRARQGADISRAVATRVRRSGRPESE